MEIAHFWFVRTGGTPHHLKRFFGGVWVPAVEDVHFGVCGDSRSTNLALELGVPPLGAATAGPKSPSSAATTGAGGMPLSALASAFGSDARDPRTGSVNTASARYRVVQQKCAAGAGRGQALTTAVCVLVWSDSYGLALTIAISRVLSMIVAGIAGSAIPIVLTMLRQDPAQSSSIILTTVTDVAGFIQFSRYRDSARSDDLTPGAPTAFGLLGDGDRARCRVR